MNSGSSGVNGWGVASGHFVDEKKLEPLGLYCTGGGYINYDKNEKTWIVRSRKNDFRMSLDEEQYKNIEYYYNVYLRKDKLNKINERREDDR